MVCHILVLIVKGTVSHEDSLSPKMVCHVCGLVKGAVSHEDGLSPKMVCHDETGLSPGVSIATHEADLSVYREHGQVSNNTRCRLLQRHGRSGSVGPHTYTIIPKRLGVPLWPFCRVSRAPGCFQLAAWRPWRC